MSTERSEKYLYQGLTYKVIGAIYAVHGILGPVHKETIYQKALSMEFTERNIRFEMEKPLNVMYKGKSIGVYRPDFIIDDRIILEIKVTPFIAKAMREQVFYYLKGSRYKLVLLANFGARKVEVKRFIYT